MRRVEIAPFLPADFANMGIRNSYVEPTKIRKPEVFASQAGARKLSHEVLARVIADHALVALHPHEVNAVQYVF